MRHHLLLILVLGPLLTACTSTRKHLDRAAVYEREGMLEQAHERYAHLHQRKPRSVEAHVGMQRTAQGIFDRLQQDASALYMLNDLAGGDAKRQEAAAYEQRMERRGLELQWDPLLETRRREAQLNKAARLYDSAMEAFRADRFAEAEDLAGQSLRLDPSPRETTYLLKLAQMEPLYRQGKRAMDLGLWRDAYRAFKRVTDRDAGYKDAWTLQEQAKAEAQVVLAYVPLFERGLYGSAIALANQGQLEAQLAASTKQAILDLKDPLFMLVDRDNTAQLLAEQERQMSGVYDERYVVEAGKLIGASYVLTARILRYDEVLKREIEVQMQVLDAENGRIHVSEIVRVNKQELARGNTRSQLLERAAKRMAARVAAFDPHKR